MEIMETFGRVPHILATHNALLRRAVIHENGSITRVPEGAQSLETHVLHSKPH